MKPKQTEWLSNDERGLSYHTRQWDVSYRSTEKFLEFVSPVMGSSTLILDIGCGGGAATYRFASKHKSIQFIGLDLSEELVALATDESIRRGCANLRFMTENWFDLKVRTNVDGVVSLQTLSWLPDWKEPLKQIFEKIGPRWLAMSSLFYEGDISCTIDVMEHQRNRRSFYNVYSLKQIDSYVRTFGYSLSRFEPFEIDVDLPEPENKDLMGTYTVKVKTSNADVFRRIQVSGPLLMNWGFVMISKD